MECIKAVYCHPAYLNYMQSTSWETLGWNIWKFTVHVLLKTGLENFEHYFTSNCAIVCNCVVILAFFGISFLWDWNENWHFPKHSILALEWKLWPLLSFPNCWHIECSTFTASSIRIWNSSTGIISPPLALFIVMLPKNHLSSYSRMSGSRWVITPSWLSGSWRSFLYSCSVYSCHLFLISSASVRSIPFLSFIVPIFAWNILLASLIFLKSPLVFPILLSSSISLHWSVRKAFLFLLAIFWNSEFKWVYLSFSPLLFASLLFTAICKALVFHGEGNGTPLQYLAWKNPTDGGAWWAAIHGFAKIRTWLSDFTFNFYFYALEKEMATHSSVLAWRNPGTWEPGGFPSMGSHRFGHDCSDSAAAAAVFHNWSS